MATFDIVAVDPGGTFNITVPPSGEAWPKRKAMVWMVGAWPAQS